MVSVLIYIDDVNLSVRGDTVSDVSTQIQVGDMRTDSATDGSATERPVEDFDWPAHCHLGLFKLADTHFLRIEGWATILPNFSPSNKFMGSAWDTIKTLVVEH